MKRVYAISKQIGDTPRLIAPLINLGQIAWAESDFTNAKRLWEEGLALARVTQQTRYEAMLLANLGILAGEAGDFAAAIGHYDNALQIHRANGDTFSIAYALMHTGDANLQQQQWETALERMTESHALFQQLGRQYESALTSVHIGHILLEQERFTESRMHIEEGLSIAASIEDTRSSLYGFLVLGLLYGHQGDLPAAFTSFRKGLAIAQQTEGS